MTSRETEKEGPPSPKGSGAASTALSKWRRLKESLFGRKAEPREAESGAAPEPPSLERKKTVVEEYYEKEHRERERWERLTPEQKRAERERRRQEFLASHSAAKPPEKAVDARLRHPPSLRFGATREATARQAEGIEGGNEREKREKETDAAGVLTEPPAFADRLRRGEPAAAFSSLSPTPEVEKEKGDREKKGRSRSQKRQRVKGVRAVVTPAEYDAIQERARAANLSVGAYLRACALGDKGPRAKRAPPVQGDLLAQAIAALNRVGNNLNQIAHHLNAGGSPNHAQIIEAKAEHSECVKAILKSLGRATE